MPDVQTRLREYWDHVAAEHPAPQASHIEHGRAQIGPRSLLIGTDEADGATDAPSAREDEDMPQATTTPDSRRALPPRPALALVAVAVVTALVVAVTLATPSRTSPDVADGVAPLTDVDRAVAVANSLGHAVETHAPDAAIALFAPGAWATFRFGTDAVTRGMPVDDDLAEFLVWLDAQQATHSPWDCRPSTVDLGGSLADGVAVTCTYETTDAMVRATGVDPMERVATFVIGSDGIRDYEETFLPGRMPELEERFRTWVEVHHPEVASRVGPDGWLTREDAAADGRLRSRYVDMWMDDLVARGCTIVALDRCPAEREAG